MIKFTIGIIVGLYIAQNFNVTFDDVAVLIENLKIS